MPVANPMFVVTLDAKAYAEMLNKPGTDGQAVAAARRDPLIEFDDNARKIKVGYEYRAFVVEHTPFRKFIDMWTLKGAMSYATPAFKQLIADRLDTARDDMRDTFDPNTYVEPRQPKIDPNATGRSAASDLLAQDGGFVVGRGHKDTQSANLLTDILNADGKPVDMFFIEEFATELQDELTDYIDGPPEAPMSAGLRKRVAELKANYLVDWEPILAKAKQKKVKLFGMDTPTAEPGVEDKDPQYGERRCAVMNAVAVDVIEKAKAANPGAKFVVMTGEAHLNTHPGGIPGLSQLLGIPGMRVNGEGKLRFVPDDKTLRTMPDAAEQMFIDQAMDEAVKAYTALPKGPGDPSKLDDRHLRRVLQDLAEELATSGDLTDANSATGLLAHPKTKAAIKAICDGTKGRETRHPSLVEAIGKGDTATVRKLIAEDPDIVMQGDVNQRTLMHEAAKAGQADIVDILLQAGANPNALDGAYVTPLHEACGAGGDEAVVTYMVKSMVDDGGDLTIPDGNCKTGYDRVLDRKDPTMLGELVEDGVGHIEDLWVRVFEKQARDEYADAGRDPTQYLDFDPGELRALAKDRFGKMSARTRIVDPSDIQEVLNIDQESDDAIADLIARTKKRKQRRLEMLSAIDADDAGTAGGILAADPRFKTYDISEGMTALDMAALGGKDRTMMSLIQNGADPNGVNARGRTPLIEVCDKDVPKTDTAGKDKVRETAGILMDLGADPNRTDRLGATPLHYAGFHDNDAVVKDLAANGADPSIKDRRGWTALDTTIGSTNKASEQAFYDTGMAEKTPTLPAGKHSTIDLLCMATRCTNPVADEMTTRKMYERLYSMEPLRPILDLAAAATCNDRTPPNGGARVFQTDSVSVNLLYGKSTGPAGAYDEKVNTVLVATKPKNKEDAPSGKLAHELTHMTAHLVTGNEASYPFKPADGKAKQEYLDAIAADLNGLHQLCDGDPVHAWVKDRMTGRMPDYMKKTGETDFAPTDHRLLQEHIVTAPQLMAAYGPDFVRDKLPNMMAAFEKLSRQAADTLQNDPRFAKGRAKIDPAKNQAMIDRLETEGAAPKSPEAMMLARRGADFDVDGVVAKVRAAYIAEHGRQKAPDANGPSIVHSPNNFEIHPDEQRAVEKRLTLLKNILAKTMATDSIAQTDIERGARAARRRARQGGSWRAGRQDPAEDCDADVGHLGKEGQGRLRDILYRQEQQRRRGGSGRGRCRGIGVARPWRQQR